VLNKIDALWDELRTPQENEAAIVRQQHDVAQLLGVHQQQVVPVSAHKGLVGRVTGDAALFEKSRIGELERALFDELIPARQQILRRQLQQDLAALEAGQQALLGARMRDLVEQLQELESLRGKNKGVVTHMMRRVEMEKKEFDASLFKLQGTRAVFTKLSTEVYSAIGMNVVQANADAVRAEMEKVRFATGMRAPVREFFDKSRSALDESTGRIAEIAAMMESMYRRFSTDHGLNLTMPATVSLARYRDEIDNIEAIFQKQFGTATLLITSRGTLLERFFDSIATRIKQAFRAVNGDVEAWLKTVMGPLEAQIRQHREQLRHRQTSIQRIHDATDDLEQKIAAFDTARQDIDAIRARLAELSGAVTRALHAELADEAELEPA
jgi:hypothetical protein